jgi:PAS domain S-box-containing protein
VLGECEFSDLIITLLIGYMMLCAVNIYIGFFGMQILSEILLPAVLILLSGALVVFLILNSRNMKAELLENKNQITELKARTEKLNRELEIRKEIARKDQFESDRFYAMLVKSADDGISFYDRDWNLKYANEAFYSMIGLTRESYDAIEHAPLIHPDDREYESRRVRALLDSGFHDTELRLWHKEGYYIILSSKSVAVRDDNGEIIGALNISRDITRLKEVHEELIKANIEVEASNRLKSNFLANISHEIRTPLNSIVGFSNLLLSEKLTDSIKDQYIEQITYNSEKLLQIIGDIIDLARLESSLIEIAYEEASVKSVIEEVEEEALQNIRRNEKKIILKISNKIGDNGDLIFTDRNWLKRVLLHLMDNAVKFTAVGTIDLDFQRDDERLLFSIRDTGIGINKENLENIFRGFSQEIAGHHRPFEGLGVGLTLAKAVVERLGGNIKVTSDKGVGSEFSFTIPYRPASSIKQKSGLQVNGSSVGIINWSTRKCLVVDDNRDVLIYLSRILFDTGVKIFSSRSGVEAIEIFKSNPDIDIVLLDMQMPEMNGIETAQEIRKIRKDIPIVAQTAFVFEGDKDIILESGCDACLIKPIRKDQLLAAMSGFIGSN